jgi:hypothetical protein
VRRELVFLLVALAVLLVVYFTARTGPTAPETEGGALLPGFSPAGVDTIDISSAGTRVLIARAGDGWTVGSKRDDARPADPLMVEQAIAALASLDRSEVVSVRSSRHEVFGVDRRSAVVVEVRNGSPAAVALGGRGPGGSVYVRRLDEDEVYAAPGAVAEAFPTDAAAWRDRAVLRFAADRVRELVYRGTGAGGRVVAVRRTPEGWSLSGEKARAVHPRPVELVLTSIASARGTELAEQEGTAGGSARYELTLVMEDGTEARLTVRDDGPDHIIETPGRGSFRMRRERFDLIEKTILSIPETVLED